MASCSSYSCIAAGITGAVVSLAIMCITISEKSRFTPFYQEMTCDPAEATALRMSKMSAPSPLAESMGIAPGSPPYGMFFEMTTSITCTNPNQASLIMKAKGSKIQMFFPNLTSYLAGGSGLPYQLVGDGNLVNDVHLAPGGGRGQFTQLIRVAFPLADVFSMVETAAMLGYAPQFIKTSINVQSSSVLFGVSMDEEARQEQWCGSFGGSCMAQSLDTNGNPVVPAQWEPAMCSMTKAICGKENDMKAALNFEALGGAIVTTIPCPPQTGLPNSTFCNIATGPGVDPLTLQAKVIHPAKQLTVQAQQEMDDMIEEGETKLHTLLDTVIVVSVIFSVLCGGLSFLCCFRRIRAKQTPAGPEANSFPAILGARGETTDNKAAKV